MFSKIDWKTAGLLAFPLAFLPLCGGCGGMLGLFLQNALFLGNPFQPGRRRHRPRADPDARPATCTPGRRRRGNRCQGNGGAPKRGAAGPPWGDGHPRPSSPVPWGHAWATLPRPEDVGPRTRASPAPGQQRAPRADDNAATDARATAAHQRRERLGLHGVTVTPGRRHPSPGAMPGQPSPAPKTSAPGPVPARPQGSNGDPGPTTARRRCGGAGRYPALWPNGRMAQNAAAWAGVTTSL